MVVFSTLFSHTSTPAYQSVQSESKTAGYPVTSSPPVILLAVLLVQLRAKSEWHRFSSQ